MRTITDMPKTRRHKWDEIADLLKEGNALQFDKGEDYDTDVDTFRSLLYSSMKSRGIEIRTTARNNGAELCVAKKD